MRKKAQKQRHKTYLNVSQVGGARGKGTGKVDAKGKAHQWGAVSEVKLVGLNFERSRVAHGT
jgi:hypothetical protein